MVACGYHISFQTLSLDDSFHYRVGRSVVKHHGGSSEGCASSGSEYWESVFLKGSAGRLIKRTLVGI